ncbi:hypothetical protein VKS41_009385 [Umbelopsis sp. WA50703]
MVQNPDKYVNALVAFAESNNLDGIDIDWEYPGATDIPGIIPGLPSDGSDYLAFLKMLRARLPSSKSISIAAPASYWYLKNFPIVEMSKILDYIVFMTYDLHGQWDYKIPSLGPYLKSHVNWTETQSMLDLITHSGVPSNKVLLGLAKYGRSFQQVNPDCYEPTCKFTGPLSGATPGKCTNTSGYIGLGEIKQLTGIRKTYVEAGSQILLYGKDQWVAYLTDAQLASRTSQAKSMNLGGTITWALDLDSKESINKCDMSRVVMIEDLSNTACSNHDMRSYLVDYILNTVDHWHTNTASGYEEGMTKFKAYYNITDPHPPKADLDGVFANFTSYISALPSGDINQEQMSLLFFYAKRCAVFNVPTSSNKRDIELSVFGAARYALIPEEAASAISAAGITETAVAAATACGVVASQAIPIVGGIVLIGSFIANWFIDEWNKKSTPVPNSVITLAGSNENQLDKIKNLILDPNYVDDYYAAISSVDYDTDVDPEDVEIIPGPYTKETSYILNRINSPYYWNLRKKATNCKADDRVNINNEQFKSLTNVLTNRTKEETPGIPVYWINYSGESPGVACNAWYYFSKKMLEGEDINTINHQTRYTAGKDRSQYLPKYDCSKYGTHQQRWSNGIVRTVSTYQRDEFPFAKTYEGMTNSNEYDISIACIYGPDNTSDGSYFGQFLRAVGRYKPWNDHVIGKPSGVRRTLPNRGSFIIKIYDLPPLDTCPENYLTGSLVHGYAMTPDGTDNKPNVINHYYEAINN